MYEWHKKEAPLLGLQGSGGGLGFLAGRGGAAGPLEITGANVVSHTNSTHSYAIITTTGNSTVTFSRGFVASDGVEMLLVGGGGGGGSQNWGATGGGGGGGVVFVPSSKAPEIVTGGVSVNVVVGAPGPIGNEGGTTVINPSGPSAVTRLDALGGGAGAPNSGNGAIGGSGGGGQFNSNDGGAASQPTANPGISGINQFGYPGSQGSPSPTLTGGAGGGAGGGGPVGTHNTNGGPGINIYPLSPNFMDPTWPSGVITALGGFPSSSPHWHYFGAGGGGGTRSRSPFPGGQGGGGAGAMDPAGPAATAGAQGRGAGGGGGAENEAQRPSAAGGSGCIIIRWVTPT